MTLSLCAKMSVGQRIYIIYAAKNAMSKFTHSIFTLLNNLHPTLIKLNDLQHISF